MDRVIAYYRVSTASQGASGLGLDAQKRSVKKLCASREWAIAAEFTEIESGKQDNRPQLQQALTLARRTGFKLVVAKLDRLSRSAQFTLKLRDSSVDFVCADNPDVTRLTVGLLAIVNEDERERVSERTKAALQAAKARGVKLGNPLGAETFKRAGKGNTAALAAIKDHADKHAHDLATLIDDLAAEGITTEAGIARELNRQHIQTQRGRVWHPSTVSNLLKRMNRLIADG